MTAWPSPDGPARRLSLIALELGTVYRLIRIIFLSNRYRVGSNAFHRRRHQGLDFRFEDKDKNKDLWSKDGDKDKDLWSKDKDKDMDL